MLAQDEADGQAVQRRDAVLQGGGVLQVGHGDRGALLGEVPRQPRAAAEGAQSHYSDAAAVPVGRRRRHGERPYQRPRGAPRASSSASACTVAPTSCTPHQRGAPLRRRQGAGEAAAEPLADRALQDVAEEGFARRAGDQWLTQGAQEVQAAQQVQVVRHRLAEPESGVQEDALPVDAGPHRGAQAPAQEPVHVVHDVVVRRCPLHGAGRSLHVHQHHRGTPVGDQRRHVRVEAQGADVVHHDGAGVEGGGGDVGAPGIHRHPRLVAPDDLADHRHHAGALFRRRYGQRPRARGLAAHVDQVGALRQHHLGTRQRLLGFTIQPAVGERVRRDVQNAHDAGALAAASPSRPSAGASGPPARTERARSSASATGSSCG